MNAKDRISKELEEYQNDPAFELEVLLLEVNRQISSLMDDCGVRKSELAQRLGVSRAFVTKVLRGESNITLQTLVRIANALEAKFTVRIARRGGDTRWIEQYPRSAKDSPSHLERRLALAA